MPCGATQDGGVKVERYEKILLSFLSSQNAGSGIQAMKAEMQMEIQGRFYLESYIVPLSIILPHSRKKV